jgi:hypothetical protein
MASVIYGGTAMDYVDYEEIFLTAVEEGVRHIEGRISMREWMLLATITQKQVIQHIQCDLRKKSSFFPPVDFVP